MTYKYITITARIVHLQEADTVEFYNGVMQEKRLAEAASTMLQALRAARDVESGKTNGAVAKQMVEMAIKQAEGG